MLLLPPSCSPMHINMVIRHGTRFPTTKVIQSIAAVTAKLKSAALTSSIPSWVESWAIESYYPIEESGMLADAGVDEMVGLGQRIRLKYAHSFPTAFDKTSYTFEHTWKDRTRESAASYTSTMSFHRVASRDWCRFAFGFFGGHQPVHYEVAAKGKDEELRFFDNCPVYEQEVERNLSATAQHDLFATSDALTQAQRHLQDALHIPSLTLKDLSAIYDACAFDVAVHGIFDHWCTLMPLDVLQVMEYWKELKQYYRKSHGNSMSVAIASPLLRDVVEAMVNFTTSPNEYGVQGHFRFAHAETLLPLLSLLGFQSNDPKLLATATPPYDRHFRSAELAPFGGNVAFVLYRCTHDSEPLVQVVVNERQVATPGLGCVLCPLSEWIRHFDHWAIPATFNQICSIP
ncbi:hypothetical protein H310_14604 [Aphanomyces invadans]|uniref:Multiple inositol polyphosphate phosphatase 1 n=1 Tax=Aphanomyces invadans TaxID=157072 RepID=A0A024TAJ9_9STRA|nr:hypothetical protein H310_14604 [Aphanomyces invadans]ETV90646.1 hypothetical protein H310_14604 [Aphanomyces invadans]|eukprot:XP_008880716.1 hypothetical protein H310_14604 [Aphanomyces invadans]